MIRTVRENINAAYDLHDMNVISLEANGNDLILRTQSGMIKIMPPSSPIPSDQVDGHVEFHEVDWDFCFVYLLEHNGNIGKFKGEKLMLSDFIKKYPIFGFSVMDTAYGYNMTKYSGYLTSQRKFYECFIEIYHKGDMVFVEE